MGHLELSAHMTVRPGCLEGFTKQAAECIRITNDMDTRTLRYDWFLSTDGTECEVREAYTGPERFTFLQGLDAVGREHAISQSGGAL